MYVYVQINLYISICIWMFMYIFTDIYEHIYIYMYRYIHIFIDIYTSKNSPSGQLFLIPRVHPRHKYEFEHIMYTNNTKNQNFNRKSTASHAHSKSSSIDGLPVTNHTHYMVSHSVSTHHHHDHPAQNRRANTKNTQRPWQLPHRLYWNKRESSLQTALNTDCGFLPFNLIQSIDRPGHATHTPAGGWQRQTSKTNTQKPHTPTPDIYRLLHRKHAREHYHRLSTPVGGKPQRNWHYPTKQNTEPIQKRYESKEETTHTPCVCAGTANTDLQWSNSAQ